VFDGDNPVDYRVPWPIPKGKTLRRSDLDDFKIRLDFPGGLRFYGQAPQDGVATHAFISIQDVQVTDAPVYVAGGMFGKALEHLTLPPCLRPGGAFLPLMEGKWIYQYTDNAYAYVSGSGTWVITRPVFKDEWRIPQYFMQDIDATTRTPLGASKKLAFRDVARWSSERTLNSTVVPAELPCGHNLPVLVRETGWPEAFFVIECWANSFVVDYFTRLISSGHVTLDVLGQLPAPLAHECLSQQLGRVSDGNVSTIAPNPLAHAVLDAIIAELFELTLAEFVYILSTFPLLDRDQPPLPGDYRVRATNKGIDRRKQSFVTRDLDVRFASPPPIPIVAGQGLTTPRAGEGLTKRTSSLADLLRLPCRAAGREA
jgi:hypothetical protein